jgi:hypothetical protein
MNPKVFISIFLLILVIILAEAIACKDTQDNSTTIVFPSSPDSIVSYTKQVDPLFQERCAISGCHNSSSFQAKLDLSSPSYHALMTFNAPVLVVARNANNSVLYQRLALPATDINHMPYPGTTQLNSNQINGIKNWINQGANDTP